ncbi:MAG: CHAT domain-containing protein, partial [Cyanobacteria bacterium P01_H01_bin.152]
IRQAIAATLADTNSVPTTDWYIFVRDVFATDLNQLRRSTTDSFSQSLVDNPLWYTIDKHFPPLVAVAGELQELRQTARALGDVQAEATVLGRLGALYEQIEDWENASQLTQQGLVLAQSYGLGQVAYDLQAQLGRIELALGDRQRAIAAYRASVATLQTLREDVVSVSSEAQYSFQQSIEPIYRELATLLLTESPDTDSDENLRQAREVIELLQLAELDNFFREACLSGDTVEIDALDNQAAVLYPILLPDRIDVVLSLPDRSYQNFNVPVTPLEVTQAVTTLQRGLLNPLSDATTTARGIGIFVAEGELENRPADQIQILPVAQQLYDWLIRPAEQALADSDVQTLVFVLDDSLRSIPMSVLYDGEQYLIEKYAIAATPGLRLVNPEPLPRKELSVILAGLSQQGESARADQFSPLPFVADEVKTIEQLFPSTVLLDEAFNVESFKANVGTVPAPIVHLATHGQFGDTLDNTFVLTWDDALDANRFSNILLTSELSREQPIELLVLSACETAKGDELSVLGLAGIAIRSGARSTLASLWQVSDQATSDLMGEFYQQLGSSDLPKAEAIRQAQLALLNQSQYSHPFYWSAFVLLGNWL